MFRRSIVLVALTFWFLPPPAHAKVPEAAAETRAEHRRDRAQGGTPGTAEEAKRLAERERQSQDQQKFEGGGRISMGTTTVIIILLLVIVLVLII